MNRGVNVKLLFRYGNYILIKSWYVLKAEYVFLSPSESGLVYLTEQYYT